MPARNGTRSTDHTLPARPPHVSTNPADKIDHARTLSSDTVLVAFDNEQPQVEMWRRTGVRIRPPNSEDFLRRMLRARKVAVTVRSFDPTRPLSYTFRLGNVEQVTKANVYRKCG